jgi:hypothetical protein
MGVALRDLAGEGCYALRSVRDAYLSIAARKKGVTLAVGQLKASVGARLVDGGWAEWSGRPEAPRLVITPQGKALASKLAAVLPQELAEDIESEERVTAQGPERVLVDRRESPLAWLARRKNADGTPMLDPLCFAAGERLRADFERTGLRQRVTVDWERFGAGASSGRHEMTLSDAMIGARQRIDKALAAVGADMAGLLVDICCHLKGLDLVERERGWPPRSAKLVLGMALARLAAHYGLHGEFKGRDRSNGIVQWADEGVGLRG